MVELELLGVHSDGEHLALTDEHGKKYLLSITDALRTAVRRDRKKIEAIAPTGDLSPRDIQALLRAGASVDDIATEYGIGPDRVRRFESPVISERSFVVSRFKEMTLGDSPDAPVLGEIIIDRLAMRGVDTRTLLWDAVRRPELPWEAYVSYVAGGVEREARWRVDINARTFTALDDESRWLSEADVSPRAAGRPQVHSLGQYREASANPPAAQTGEPSATEKFLDQLARSRGKRESTADLVDEIEEELEAPESEVPSAHPPASRPDLATDDEVLADPEQFQLFTLGAKRSDDGEEQIEEEKTPSTGRGRRTRSRRQSVPSWDEIVFGTKSD